MGRFPEKARVLQVLRGNSLLLLTLLGVIFGVGLGRFNTKTIYNPSPSAIKCIGYIGELFFRALQMLILPSIIFSLIGGAASLNIKENGKITLRTFTYFILTSLFNTLLGVLLVVTIHPGNSKTKGDLMSSIPSQLNVRANTLLDNGMDLGRNIIPDNLFTTVFELTETVYAEITLNNATLAARQVKKLGKRPGTNLLGIITISLVIGSVLSTLKDQAANFLQLIQICDITVTKLVRAIIWLMPFGVASTICSKILQVSNVANLVTFFALFIATVISGIFIYQLVFMQLFYFLVTRKNPFQFYVDMLPAAMTGFAAQSSSIALPVTLQCLDEKTKIDKRISRFVVPLGITINMDGTALFVTVASIFIAQINEVPLTFVDYLSVCITATAVSIATGTIPSASMTVLFIILNVINVPTHDVGLLFSVDWFLDRLRIINNVLGDCYAAAIVQHLSKKEIEDMDYLSTTEVQNIELDEMEIN